MMLPSHLLAAVALGLGVGLARGRALGRREWWLALGFAVIIDVDHLLALPGYLAIHGLAGLDVRTALSYGAAWQGIMHSLWGLVPVAAFTAWHRTWIPAAFWSLHLVQDFVVARHFIVWGGSTEWLVIAGLAALVASLALTQRAIHSRRRGTPTPGLGAPLLATLATVRRR